MAKSSSIYDMMALIALPSGTDGSRLTRYDAWIAVGNVFHIFVR